MTNLLNGRRKAMIGAAHNYFVPTRGGESLFGKQVRLYLAPGVGSEITTIGGYHAMIGVA